MLRPENIEGELTQKEIKEEERSHKKKTRQVPVEGPGSLELTSYKNPKTWKKSITKFIRNQLRSTRSNEGDRPSGSNESFVEKDIPVEQKWQSLGKMFRRQNVGDNWKSPQESSQKKSIAVKRVLSSYFSKSQKSSPIPDE